MVKKQMFKKGFRRLMLAFPLLTLALFLGCCHMVSSRPESSTDEYLRQRSVRLFSSLGSCSGEQIRSPSGIDYILSAGHCRHLATGDSIIVELENHTVLMRRIIAEDVNSDLLLIEGVPNLEGIPVALSSFPRDHIRTFTHGNMYDTYKTEGEIIQNKVINIGLRQMKGDGSDEPCDMPKNKIAQAHSIFGDTIDICLLSVDETVTTAKIVPGSSGGMAVDDDGMLIGVASATDGEFGYMVKLGDIRAFLANY